MFKKGLLFSKFSHDLGSPFFNETLKMSFLPDLCCPGKARELAAVGPRVPLRDFARLTPTRPWSGTTHSSNSDSLRLLTASIFQCIIISPNSFPYRKDYYHSRKLYGKRLRAKFAHYWFSSLFYYYSAQRIPMFFEGARKRERAKKIRKKELLSLQKKLEDTCEILLMSPHETERWKSNYLCLFIFRWSHSHGSRFWLRVRDGISSETSWRVFVPTAQWSGWTLSKKRIDLGYQVSLLSRDFYRDLWQLKKEGLTIRKLSDCMSCSTKYSSARFFSVRNWQLLL